MSESPTNSLPDARFKNKRSATQKAADLAFFEHWHLRGKSERDLVVMIAKERPYSLCKATIHSDLNKSRKRWQEEAMTERSAAVAKELAKIEVQEDELWAAWERSKLDHQSKTVEDIVGAIAPELADFKKPSKEKTTTEGQCGEPAYQRLLNELRDQRRKLLGLDAETVIKDSRDPKNSITISGQPAGPIVHLIVPAGRAAGIMPTETEPPKP